MVNDYTIALFGHLVGVLLFVSGITLAGAAFETARRRTEPAEIALILKVARAAVPMVGIGAILVLGFGLWLVDTSGIGYDAGWVQAALGLFILALILGAIGGRRPRHARVHATTLAATGQPSDEALRAMLGDRVSRATNYASTTIVLAILALMTFKP